MKKELKVTALTTIVVVSSIYGKAQQPVPPSPPPAPVQAPPPGRAGRGLAAPLQQLVTLSGHVTEYATNDRWEYDQLSLRSNGKITLVKFPAHLAEQLMAAAPKGAEVSISGTTDETPDGTLFRLYSLKAGGKEITNTPLTEPPLPTQDELKNFSGTVSELSHGRNGEINGVFLSNNMLIKLPPPAIEQLTAYLKDGISISGTGVLKSKPAGVVMARNIRVTDARTISINGQTYLIR